MRHRYGNLPVDLFRANVPSFFNVLEHLCEMINFNPLSANSTKWSITFKQFGGNLPTSYLGVFDHFVGLALEGLNKLNSFLFDFFNFL